jgi:hypothetical protein
MSKVFAFWALLGILMLSTLAVAPSGAVASSPSQQACEAGPDGIVGTADDGVFSRDGGHVSCTYSTTSHVGNSEHSQTTDTTDTESSNGTLNNTPKHAEKNTCDGPGGSTDKSAHCR